ncbi:hypothetical protein [Staphylococcus pettenkoferi]
MFKTRENETFELVEVENESEMKNIYEFNKKNIKNVRNDSDVRIN